MRARCSPGSHREEDHQGRRSRIPLPGTEGEDRGRRHQAVPHAGGSLPRLQSRRRRPLPRDRGGSRQGLRLHREGQPRRRDLQRDRRAGPRRHRARSRASPSWKGKGVLFKRFADIDVFDIEVDEKDPAKFIDRSRRSLPRSAGSTSRTSRPRNASRSRRQLKKRLKIPVFHDDQHGTAIISAAALLNALEIVGKKIDEVKVVFAGAGASAIACAKLYLSYGVRKENLRLVDRTGVIYPGAGRHEQVQGAVRRGDDRSARSPTRSWERTSSSGSRRRGR